ncbi:MAG: iron-sulfur cluster insertion protein ErpA [Chloroflexota bacterium]
MMSTLTLTDEAVVRLRNVLDNQHAPDGALRVFVSPGGCSGFSYGMSLESEPADDDEVVEQSGVKVVVDPFSLQYLSGAQIDFVDSLMGGGFTVVNPNAVKSCACGQSFDTTFGGGAAKPCH